MAQTTIDLGGNDLIVDGIRVGATAPGQAGTTLAGSELTVLDGVTAGTVSASKAVVVDSSRNITNFGSISGTGAETILSGTAVPAGGTAGSGYKLSSTANLGLFFGSGAPSLSAAQGSLYIRTDGSSTSTRLYVNTNGTTGWTNFTSAT